MSAPRNHGCHARALGVPAATGRPKDGPGRKATRCRRSRAGLSDPGGHGLPAGRPRHPPRASGQPCRNAARRRRDHQSADRSGCDEIIHEKPCARRAPPDLWIAPCATRGVRPFGLYLHRFSRAYGLCLPRNADASTGSPRHASSTRSSRPRIAVCARASRLHVPRRRCAEVRAWGRGDVFVRVRGSLRDLR